MTANFVNGDDMIGVVLCLEIEDQWWKSDYPKGGCGENPAVEAGSRACMQDLTRRTGIESKVIGKIIQKFLNARRRLQAAQKPEFGRAEPKRRLSN